MHNIRSKARHLAWKGDGGGVLNPFGRLNNRSRTASTVAQKTNPDLEKAIPAPKPRREHSETCVSSVAELQRVTSARRLGAPRHASTVPVTSTNAQDFSPPHHPSNDISSNEISSNEISSSSEDSPTSETKINQPQLTKRVTRSVPSDQQNGNVDVQRTDSDEPKPKKHFTLWSQLRATVFGSWVNVLLVCVPVGIALNYTKVSRVAVFVINFLAIIPLAGMLSYSTEEISMRVGETLGGLLNASFGNAVELIVGIIALVANEINIVKTSLIGSMLSNLLLVMGMCFFFGGLRREEQFFNVTVAQTAASLLALAVGSLIIPTVFHQWGSSGTPQFRESKVPELSHGTAIILLIVYACYLFFQLKTHSTMYNRPSEKVPMRPSSKIPEGSVSRGIAAIGAGSAAQAGGSLLDGKDNIYRATGDDEEDEDEKGEPQLSVIGAIATLCISTAFVGICAEFMVNSIAALVSTGNISAEFVGLILIPIVGNAAEHATAVTVACKDKMDLAIGVAVGSSLQIALLVLPFIVVLGWIIDRPMMTLEFDGFLLALLFVAVLLVNYLISDGRSHWLEGVLLMATYIIIAVAAWFYPAGEDVVG